MIEPIELLVVDDHTLFRTGLRLIVLEICATLSECDLHIADAEYEMLCALADHWDLPLPPLRTTSPKAMQTVGAAAVA